MGLTSGLNSGHTEYVTHTYKTGDTFALKAIALVCHKEAL